MALALGLLVANTMGLPEWFVLIFALPIASRALQLPTGVAGAWIGTSEFADAAGFAAAQSYAGNAGNVPGITGHPEAAVNACTLIQVIGRDLWIGIWALVLSIVASLYWNDNGGVRGHADAGEIWRRFPKFVIGFLIASVVTTVQQRPGVHRRRGAQHRAALRAVDAGVRRLPDEVRPMIAILSRLARARAGARADAPAPARCASCVHFDNRAATVEAALPGLRSFGSTESAVRTADGVCGVSGRCLSAARSCDAHAPRRA